MDGELVVVSGPDKDKRFKLEDGKSLRIGRGLESDIVLTDPRVSRTHCIVEIRGKNAHLIDELAKGNTFVNGEPEKDCMLRNCDTIKVGESEIRFFATKGDVEHYFSEQAAPKEKTPSDLTQLVGKTISHFSLEKILGKGSMGVVFLATDTDNDRQIALKILHPMISSDEEQSNRFVRAMKTMLPIKHPNLVRLYGAGRTAIYSWLSMEYVDGENMTSVINRIGSAGMLDWRYGFRVAFDIGMALQEAYYHQIIHRNITPTSILIRKADKVIKLGDMMLAKALEGSLAGNVTSPGQIVGSLAYMAPERTTANQQSDTRSDIYSLGATVYALLTGRPPFEAMSQVELIRKIREDHPTPPKTYQLAVPDLFQNVVMQMLAKKPQDRFESPSELLKALDRVKQFHSVVM